MDTTGGANAVVSAYQGLAQQRTGDAARQNALVGQAAANLGQGMEGYALKQKKDQAREALKKHMIFDLKFDPNEAESIVATENPQLIQDAVMKKHDETQGQGAAKALGQTYVPGVSPSTMYSAGKADTARQESYGHADSSQQRELDWHTQATADAEKRKQDEENAVAAGTGALLAPIMDDPNAPPSMADVNSPNFKQNTSAATPDEATVTARFSAASQGPKPYRPKALDAAREAAWKPAKPAPLSPFEQSRQEAAGHAAGAPVVPKPKELRGNKGNGFETPLSPEEETQFNAWKAQYAPQDSGADYDLRGAFKAGLTPDPQTGHWPDTYKKPNHPTFSNQSIYAVDAPGLAGTWDGEKYIPHQDPLQNIGRELANQRQERDAADYVSPDAREAQKRYDALLAKSQNIKEEALYPGGSEKLASDLAAAKSAVDGAKTPRPLGSGGPRQKSPAPVNDVGATPEELGRLQGSPLLDAWNKGDAEYRKKALAAMRRGTGGQ